MLQVPDLDIETVEELFRLAITTHPRIPGSDSHVRNGMMEFARLVTAEHNGWLAARHKRLGMDKWRPRVRRGYQWVLLDEPTGLTGEALDRFAEQMR
jgi:hypothetical protein